MHKKLLVRILAIIIGVLGVIVLSLVFLPIAFYEFTSAPLASYLSPIPETKIDYTKASNWFVGAKGNTEFARSRVSFYTLTIKRLGIEKAVVSIGGEDLKESLIQYPGTANPGKPGNAVIFGHSILPIFYNPKDYLSIFSTLPSLQKDDEIDLDYDGVSYKYRVEEKFEVEPTDIQVLEQDVSDSFLTLVTCVPPGDPRRPRRLIVHARVVPIQANANLRN